MAYFLCVGIMLIIIGGGCYYTAFYSDHNIYHQIGHLIQALVFIIPGSISVGVFVIVKKIEERYVKKENNFKKHVEPRGIKEYTVVYKDGEQYIVQVPSNSKWNDIVNICKQYETYPREIVYLIDEHGHSVYRGGYLG